MQLFNSHQLQSRSSLTDAGWQDEGSPLPGTGSMLSVRLPISHGEPGRFYRVDSRFANE